MALECVMQGSPPLIGQSWSAGCDVKGSSRYGRSVVLFRDFAVISAPRSPMPRPFFKPKRVLEQLWV